jgi:hypothetical protein
MAKTAKSQMDANTRTKRVLMWSVSSPAADLLFSLFNLILIVGAAAVLLGTIGSIKMNAVREMFSNERISANEAATAIATAESDKAKAEAANARLELAKFKAPRVLSLTQLAGITTAMGRFPRTQFDVAIGPMGDPEPEVFGRVLATALINAGWIQMDWNTSDVQMRLTRPGGAAVGYASVTNVIVDIHPSQSARLWPAAQALAVALNADGIDAEAQQGSGGRNTNDNAIHVMIGRKM